MFCTQFFLLDCQLQLFDLVDFNSICFKFLIDVVLNFKFYKIIARLQEGAIARQPAPYFLDGEELFGRQRRYKQQILFGNLKINVWLSIKQIFVCKIRFRDGLLRQLSQCFLQGKAEEADRYEWFQIGSGGALENDIQSFLKTGLICQKGQAALCRLLVFLEKNKFIRLLQGKKKVCFCVRMHSQL